MITPKPPPETDATLRQRAEAQWRKRIENSADAFGDLTLRDTNLLMHELHVHQIELEMQNEELRRAKTEADDAKARYQDLYDLAPVGYCTVNADGVISQANLTLTTLLGVTHKALIGKPLARFVCREDQDTVYRVRQQVLSPPGAPGHAGAPPTCELRMVRGDGASFWAQWTASTKRDAQGAPELRLVVVEISARKAAEAETLLAASVFKHAREGIMITRPDGTIMDVNDTFTRITGYTRDEVVGQSPRMLNSGRHGPDFYVAMWQSLKTEGYWSGEIWNRRKSGEVFAEIQTISAVRDAQGQLQHYVALFSDITAQKEHQRQLEHIAHFDALTNLPNRVLLADRLHQAVAQATRRGDTVAVAYLDLDGFKSVNDHYGHDVGDQLLIALASNMKDALREGDTMARIGGDEFVAVFTDLTHPQASLPLLTRLLEAAAQPVLVGDIQVQVSASLGVTFYPQAQEIEADQLLRQADQAMYQAKMAGRNRYHVFDALQDTDLRVHHEDLHHIERALARHEFVLHFQPKVNMRTGQVIGAEALIRWQHPEKGLLAPATFLPVIEEHPRAVAIGEWVIDMALQQIERWREAGLDLGVSVNIGARQLQQGDFVERLKTILAAHPKVVPSCLELEILETSAVKDMAQVSSVIDACQQMGIAFALDDFGTGYSSLTYLKRLHVAMLKIDQSFVRDMLQDADDRSILQGVIGLASAFKRGVIAEGVETIAHGTALLELGCDLAQGYCIARPMPGDAMPDWVETWAGGSNPFG
jgi:diguanylate cyclase (GGDEF)-like protein/PAS domain S-box-containing protein